MLIPLSLPDIKTSSFAKIEPSRFESVMSLKGSLETLIASPSEVI